jgi:hypothetical protein
VVLAFQPLTVAAAEELAQLLIELLCSSRFSVARSSGAMDVPTCSADSRSIPAFPFSEVRKVTHLMWVNPRLAMSENQLRSLLPFFAMLLTGMPVANLKVATSAIV